MVIFPFFREQNGSLMKVQYAAAELTRPAA